MKSSENQTQSQDTAKPASPSRRRLLRAGAIGAPALLALKSTPVMACNCKLPSGFSVSGNLSRNGGAACAVGESGPKPTDWRKSPLCDTGYGYKGTTCYKDEKFGKYFTNYTGYNNQVLDTCLKDDSDHRGLALSCFMQGATYGGTNFPTSQTVQNIWNQGVCGSGYPVPGTSLTWTKNQCLAYMQYLTGQTPTYR